MARVLEAISMFILGILLVLAFTHFINGTLLEWTSSKFFTKEPNA